MSQSTFILCPGQGAQALGMGRNWYDAFPEARATFEEANDVLGFDLSAICFAEPSDKATAEINKTDISQPAIYTTSVACYRALVANGMLDENSVVGAAGLSLGEFVALHLAECFDFASGLNLVRLRGQAMQEAAEAQPSTMLAVTGDVTEEAMVALCDAAREDGILVPANYNSGQQVVLSGSFDACERAAALGAEQGYRTIPLSVAGAFHSPIMQPAADRLAEALNATPWQAPKYDVISNVTAQNHTHDAATMRQRMVEQLTSPVRWSQSMQWAGANIDATFVELAPGKVLTGLMRRIDRTIKPVSYNDVPVNE